jgi:hypothetical protein
VERRRPASHSLKNAKTTDQRKRREKEEKKKGDIPNTIPQSIRNTQRKPTSAYIASGVVWMKPTYDKMY